MRVIDGDGLGAKIRLKARLVEGDRMQLVSTVAGAASAAGIRQEVGQHLIAPASPVLERRVGELSRDVGLASAENTAVPMKTRAPGVSFALVRGEYRRA